MAAQTATFISSQRWVGKTGIEVLVNDDKYMMTDRQANHLARTIISDPWRAI